MRINGTLLLTSVLMLGAFVLVRSDESFLHGVGYAFLAGACLLQLRYLVGSIRAYRRRTAQERIATLASSRSQ